ncbi:MAG: MBL fold metallo-hydrolase [Lentimicrobiaceae bacterium]|jgi:glyoxylase-like metal-dependent hydrolase (beta-lactamase superfamily II)
MKFNSSVSLILVFLLLSTLCIAQQQEPKPVKLNKISDNMYEVLDGKGARSGLFIGDNGVTVIDAKQDEISVKQTLAEIAKITDKPVKYLIDTHSDGDHVTGNQFFPNSVTIIAHENCRKEFFHTKRDGSLSEWNNLELLPFIPSVTFNDRMDIYLGSQKVELFYFGVGHTTGDLVVYFRDQKIAFIGDQVFTGRPQLIHSYKGGNSFEHVKTLTKMLAKLDAEKFFSGHSEMLDRAGIQKHIDEMKSLQAKIKSLIADNKSLDEIKNEFVQNQQTLAETIFNEIKNNIN